jgi:hypothetical protein
MIGESNMCKKKVKINKATGKILMGHSTRLIAAKEMGSMPPIAIF